VLKAEDLTLDPTTGETYLDGQPVRLTRLEFRLLHCLMANYRRVAPSSRLIEFAWPDDRGDLDVLKTHVSHLRTKLGFNRDGGKLAIENVPGIGYRLRPLEAAQAD
jgi:DNA-binding response OmpR family regulator